MLGVVFCGLCGLVWVLGFCFVADCFYSFLVDGLVLVYVEWLVGCDLLCLLFCLRVGCLFVILFVLNLVGVLLI